jgi:hypothetical protein
MGCIYQGIQASWQGAVTEVPDLAGAADRASWAECCLLRMNWY